MHLTPVILSLKMEIPRTYYFPDFDANEYLFMEFASVPILPCIAYFYSSPGYGASSRYLAGLALYGLDPEMMQSYALILGLYVSSTTSLGIFRNDRNQKCSEFCWPQKCL
jgi:hypothetical protein